MRNRAVTAALAALAIAALPRTAAAGGLELLPGGTRSLSRGGAVAAKPEDPMVLLHNPAGLASLPGDQLMLNIDVPVHEMCVDPYGYYGWGVYQAGDSEFGNPLELDDPRDPTIGATYATTPLPQVCNSASVYGIPHIAWAGRLTENLSMGAGFVAPTVVTGLQFGGNDGTINIGGQAFPTPTRYQMIRQKVDFALAPSVGLAYRFMPQLAVGVNLQVAMLSARTWAMQNATSGTQPSTDWLAELEASDYFLPAATVSVHAKPIPQIDLVGSFRWVDDFNGTGKVTYTTNAFHEGARSGPVPFRNDSFDLRKVQVGVPWALTLAARYASLLPDAETKASGGDPIARERWDVEIDTTYNLNERASKNRVAAGEDVTIITRAAGRTGSSTTVPLADLSQLEIDRHQVDTVAVRIGGSYAVIPRTIAVHGGGFVETRGVDASYANIDSFAFARAGFGVGLTWRVSDFDFLAGYGHIFQETLEVRPPPHQPIEQADANDVTSGFDQRVGGSFAANGIRDGGVVLTDPSAPETGDALARLQQSSAAPAPSRPERIINAGRYTASFDIISVGMQYHF